MTQERNDTMTQQNIEEAKKDKRVTYHYLLNNINMFNAMPNNNPDKIIIYCHGLGANRCWATRYYKELLENNIGIIAFDLPGHGKDKTPFTKFTLELCLSYLEQVISYAKNTYQSKLYLLGSSYGGFVLLNKLMIQNKDIEKTFLISPAINFCEIIERKAGININEYLKTTNHINIFYDIDIYKEPYNKMKKQEQLIKHFHFNNISIIHGKKDRTVLLKDVETFSTNNNLKLKIVEEGKHELHGHEREIVDFILENI